MVDAKMPVIDLVSPGKRCRVRLRRGDSSKVTSEAFITCVTVVEPRQESIPWRLTTDSLSRPDRQAPGITDPGEVTVTFKLSGKPIEGK